MSPFDCQVSFVPVPKIDYFSSLVKDYIAKPEQLKPFFNYELSEQGLKQAVADRRKVPIDRALLAATIKKQYGNLELSDAAKHHLDLLSLENTFTVCSAHQPNLMTGYLYFFYKIIHSIKLAAQLKLLCPQDNFVPIFYIGSEDNDFEELGHFRYANKNFVWETNQTGAVGMMHSDMALAQLMKELLPLLGPIGPNLNQLKESIKSAYAQGNKIAAATRILINDFLGEMGVLVIDANDKALKKQFAPIIKQEILAPKAFELVAASSARLQQHYKAQAFFRPINFFYLKENLRERIEKDGEDFIIVNTDIRFSRAEMEQEIENFPERFSPNVILRGLYQESILPNIAFIGGGSELAYWMQLKDLFTHYQVFYPMVILRQSVLIMDNKTAEAQAKTALSDEEMFSKTETLIKNLVENEKREQWSIEEYTSKLDIWEKDLTEQYLSLDANLKSSIQAVMTKVNRQFDILDKKINRSLKRKLDLQIDRIDTFKSHAFPNDSLQERYDTFMPYYLDYGKQLFEDLLKNTDPLGKEFLILKYVNDK